MAEVLRERGLSDRIALDRQSCFGRCSRGPNVYVRMLPIDAGQTPHPRGLSSLYNWVGVDDVDADVAAIVSEHIVSKRVANPLIERAARLRASRMSEQPFHARSSPVATDRDRHPRDPETT